MSIDTKSFLHQIGAKPKSSNGKYQQEHGMRRLWS